jgi:hypothetical protein
MNRTRPHTDITTHEVVRAIARARPDKAPGTDAISNRALHLGQKLLAPLPANIFNHCLQTGYCPKHFKEGRTIAMRKPDKDIPKAYRPIAPLNTVRKVLEGIIAERLSYLTETYQLLPDYHFGGRKAGVQTRRCVP